MGNPGSIVALVVGAAGFIGSNVTKTLYREGHEVRALDLFMPNSMSHFADWTIGSTSDETLFAKVAQGCDIVYYLSGSSIPASGNTNISSEIDSHVRLCVKCAEICKDIDVKTFVFASSGGAVYGDNSYEPLKENHLTKPLNAYGVSKLSIENYLRVISNLYEIRTISMRISNPYGEGQRSDRSQGFIAAVMSAIKYDKELPIWGDGSVVRDFIYIDDVAKAFARCATYDGSSNTINIGSGIGHSLIDIVKQIELICNKKVKIAFQGNRKIDPGRNVLDISLARNTLNWRPEIDLKTGLAKTLEWWNI